MDELVLTERKGSVTVITLNRPDVRNAQNSALLYALDRAFKQFAHDDDQAVAVLRGAGPSFSAGHDLGPGADRDVSFERWSMWPDHVGKPGVESRLARESEVYLGLCRRWRDIPKPTIAMVHGACIAGGLMLAWSCDLITASKNAFFADPTVAMGIPGVELFAHPWIMGGRQAKEMLFTGRRIEADEALRLGMVNHVFEDDELEANTMKLAERIAQMPRAGLTLAKLAVNRAEDAMGMTNGIDSVFGLHQLGHAQIAETRDPALGTHVPALQGGDPSRIKKLLADDGGSAAEDAEEGADV